MARETPKHELDGAQSGQPGYRRGCRCEKCRKGHREAVAAWRARKRQAQQQNQPAEQPTKPLAPLTSAPVLDMEAPAGPIERALAGDLEQLVGEPPWKSTWSEIALYNARLLDQIARLDRLDLVSPIQLRTMEVLDRLRAVSQPAGNSPADAAEAFLNDLTSTD